MGKKSEKKSENKTQPDSLKHITDRQKRKRMKYYLKLSLVLAAILVLVALGMFLYLRYEAAGYRKQYAAELTEAMENAKNVCYDTLKQVNADETILESVNTQYDNAMLEDDIFKQYYLVDGLIDYTLTNFYHIISVENQNAAANGRARKNYDEEIQTLNEMQTDLRTKKEQISNIDLDDYY